MSRTITDMEPTGDWRKQGGAEMLKSIYFIILDIGITYEKGGKLYAARI